VNRPARAAAGSGAVVSALGCHERSSPAPM